MHKKSSFPVDSQNMEDNLKDNGQNETLWYRIVLKFNEHIQIPVDYELVSVHDKNSILPLNKVIKLIPGLSIRRLLQSIAPANIYLLANHAKVLDKTYEPPNFNNYYTLTCNNKSVAGEVTHLLNENDAIELAYIESIPAIPPSIPTIQKYLTSKQPYLNPAPSGIDACYAWKFKGGDGTGNIKFIDIEQGWLEQHEDVVPNKLPLTGTSHYRFQEHGTAVLGIILMSNNDMRLKGITPGANGHVVSQWRPDGSFNTADAILYAISNLHYGDILLLQAQAFVENKAWPIEIYEANFQLIRLATALGIIVVEPAGNGNHVIGNDLETYTDNFKQYLFDRSATRKNDSGAIMVSASSSTYPYKKTPYANYGNRVDCYAWGENVVTAGNYPGYSGIATNTYTANFSGTSAASAIITGAAIALQSIAGTISTGKLSPLNIREILSDPLNGTTSANGHLIDKIGVMPDLKKIIDSTLKLQPEIKLLDKQGLKTSIINNKLCK
jgi:hypothetical protein